jgi:hypothetical protein
MNESMREYIPHITPIENDMLVVEFSEKEVQEAIFRMKHNKAPVPDGFPTKFYQVFWRLIKNDLIALFRDFHAGNLPLFSLKFGIITLLPKEQEVKKSAIQAPLHA